MKEMQIECPDCHGTGLYQGLCEQDGCAVVCTKCGGKGYTTFKYNEFTGKKVKEGIKRVFENTCGIVHGPEDYKCKDGTVLHFSQYGCTYQEWLNGADPKPMEELVCPYVYYNKGIGHEPCVKCEEGVPPFGRIPDCKYYPEKDKCWKEFHEKEDTRDR